VSVCFVRIAVGSTKKMQNDRDHERSDEAP
jgi:hypothetical protein